MALSVRPSLQHFAAGDKHAGRRTAFSKGKLAIALFIALTTLAFMSIMLPSFVRGERYTQFYKKRRDLPIHMWQSALKTRKAKLFEKIRVEYGENYSQDIFFDNVNGTLVSRGRSLLTSPFDPSYQFFEVEESNISETKTSMDLARRNMIRKLAIKMLEASLHNGRKTTLIWASAGMSSAAGHGNLMTEAWTYVMEQNLRPLFQDLGIDFEGRNYGMSASYSAPEVALCVREIYGQDVDFLSWDYGQTDGKDYWKLTLFSWRAARSIQARPILTYLNIGPTKNLPYSMASQRIRAIQEMHQNGLPVLVEADIVLAAAKEGIPDTSGRTQAEIDDLPRLVQKFKCDNKLEAGEPFCGDSVFNRDNCPNRRFRVSWHPGFRTHALLGYLRTFALLDALDDTIKFLQQQVTSTTPVALLERLKADEQADYERFLAMQLPKLAKEWPLPELEPELLWNEPTFCHTGRAPSQLRMLEFVPLSNLTRATATMTTQSVGDSFMRFVADDDRFLEYHIVNCTETVRWDYQDYYYVHKDEGWKQLIVPTDAERANYMPAKREFHGLIAVCTIPCLGGKKCFDTEIFPQEYHGKKGEMEVNGVPVTNLTATGNGPDSECHLLKHSGGYRWPATPKGQYQIRARALEDEHFFRINSVVIW